MSSTNYRKTQLASAVGALVLALGAGQAYGTGFQLNENSASGLGNAFAGGAAATDDASAMWSNPAAISQFSRAQAAQAIHIITPSIKFSNSASQPAANQPLGGDGGDAGGFNFVPNLYVTVPINAAWTFGIGINAPFGLTTEFDDGWLGRYQAKKSQIQTINVNPVLSWKATPTLAIGAGVNYQYLKATLTNNANYSGALLSAAGGAGIAPGTPTFNAIAGLTRGLDSDVQVKGEDGAWGWNIGFAWDATPQVRLGFSYRSEMKYDVSGNIDFSNPTVVLPPGTTPQLAATITALSAGVNQRALYNRSVTSDITLPAIANLSMLYRLNSQWDLMADLQYTGWSSIPELKFVPTDGSVLPATPLNWDDSYKFAVGATYKANEVWKARFGIAFDQTPVTNAPTVRLPDSDRWWLAVGGEYKWTPTLKFDTGFAYIIGDSTNFNRNEGSTASYGLVNGEFKASTWILSMQATMMF